MSALGAEGARLVVRAGGASTRLVLVIGHDRLVACEGWEAEAENWIAWARQPDHDAFHLYRDQFLQLVPAAGRNTLEVGCGEGRVARALVSRGHCVTGIDASPSLIRAARDVDQQSTYLVADATRLPFADQSFDLVVAYNSLMDIREMHRAVQEAGRVLTAEGRFCICVTHPMTDAGEFAGREADATFEIRGSYLEDRVPPYAGQLVERAGLRMTFDSLRYSLEEYAQALFSAGFVIEALREPSPPATEVAQDPSKQRWRRIPNFLMLRAAKRA